MKRQISFQREPMQKQQQRYRRITFLRQFYERNHCNRNLCIHRFIHLQRVVQNELPELPDTSQKDIDQQSSVLLCLEIDFFSFLQTFRYTTKKPVLTATARELLELFNEQCLKYLRVCDYLFVDETLCPTRNQISFKQFSPNEPAKYGLLFKSIKTKR